MNKLSIAITALTTLMLSSAVLAENRFQKDIQDVSSQLNITEEKKQLLKDVMSKHQQDRKTNRQQDKDSRFEQHKARQAMREKHRSEIKGVLSQTEFETFEKIMFFKRKQRHGGPGQKKNRGQYKGQQSM
jgi:hypothetical protein